MKNYISKIHNRQEKNQAKLSALHQILEDTKSSTTRLIFFELLLTLEMKVLIKNYIISH